MKRFSLRLVFWTIAVIALSNDNGNGNGNGNGVVNAQDTAAPTSAAPTESPTTESPTSAAPTESPSSGPSSGPSSAPSDAPTNAPAAAKPKNIILYMTDDQDATADSTHPDYMPSLNTLFREGGMEFTNFYVSTALCCPSRVSILRGQYCHNTGVHDNGELNNSTYLSGGWAKFLDNVLEDETVGTILQSQGNYQTVFMGKYMNGYDDFSDHTDRPNVPNVPGLHKPVGWDYWLGMLRNKFYGPTFSIDGEEIVRLSNEIYQTDYLNDQAIDFLRNKRDPDRPFFIMVLPFAPHAPADPADRHADLYNDIKLPRTPRFNPKGKIQKQKGAWIKDLPKLLDEQIDDLDEFYRKRLRSLKAVDESLQDISDVLDELEADGRLALGAVIVVDEAVVRDHDGRRVGQVVSFDVAGLEHELHRRRRRAPLAERHVCESLFGACRLELEPHVARWKGLDHLLVIIYVKRVSEQGALQKRLHALPINQKRSLCDDGQQK